MRRVKVGIVMTTSTSCTEKSSHTRLLLAGPILASVQEAIDDMIRGQRRLDGDHGEKECGITYFIRHLGAFVAFSRCYFIILARSMTVVIVAHRLSTVRNADVIYVVDEGRIIEHGSHDDLIANDSGAYSALVRRQIDAQNSFSRSSSQLSLNGDANKQNR